MTQNSRVYKVHKFKQLIDLNGDSLNFDVNFSVVSKGNIPFEALVVDQNTLDNNKEFTYEKVSTGQFSGRVQHDKNVKRNFYLLLRSDNPCDCNVTIQKQEIPAKIESPPSQPKITKEKYEDKSPEDSEGMSWVRMVIFACILLGVGYFLYTSFYAKKTEMTTISTPVLSAPITESIAEPINPILERLRSL
jgi:hypothetical protein